MEEEEGINNEKEGDEMESLQEEKCQQKEVSAIMQTRSRHERVDLKEAKCFLCDEPAGSAGLHKTLPTIST